MSRKRALKREVSDGIREVSLGAYRASRIEVKKAEDGRNRRIRNRMCGGEGGRRARALLLPDVRQAWRVALLIALFQSLWWWLDDLEVRVLYRPGKGNG